MTDHHPAAKNPGFESSSWSNRILLLALAGILFLTLFPFRFTLQGKLPPGSTPFLLGAGEKPDGLLDIFLNVLLFIPFGFGVAEKLIERGWSRKQSFLTTWIAGSFLSYVIEFLQLYIPTRDSGWEDVFTNGSGAAVGALFFISWGTLIVAHLAKIDARRDSLTLRRVVVILAIYFGLWFGLSAALQTETHLSDWSSQSQLYVGGEPQSGISTAWKGTVSQIQFWDNPVPDREARAVTTGEMPGVPSTGLLVSYDFSSPVDLKDKLAFLPELSWTPRPPTVAESRGLTFDGRSWLTSKVPVSNLIEAFQKTNQFTVRVVCTPAETAPSGQRIISIAQPNGVADLALRQEGVNLAFWIRNPLSAGHAQLAWIIPNTLIGGESRDILFSYDGSYLSLYIDGRRYPHVYVLGPGTRLAEFVRRIKPAELEGYDYIYAALIFIPAGALLGIAATRSGAKNIPGYLIVTVAALLPPWLFERILSYVSHRPVFLKSIALDMVLAVAGGLWINSDGPSRLRLDH